MRCPGSANTSKTYCSDLALKNGEGSTGVEERAEHLGQRGKQGPGGSRGHGGRRRFPLEGRSKVAKACARLSRVGRSPPFSATLHVCDVCECVSVSVHVCEHVSVFEGRSPAPLSWVKMGRIGQVEALFIPSREYSLSSNPM